MSVGEYLARMRLPHRPLVASSFFWRMFFFLDYMHVMDCKGVAALIFGGVLASLIRRPSLGRSQVERLGRIQDSSTIRLSKAGGHSPGDSLRQAACRVANAFVAASPWILLEGQRLWSAQTVTGSLQGRPPALLRTSHRPGKGSTFRLSQAGEPALVLHRIRREVQDLRGFRPKPIQDKRRRSRFVAQDAEGRCDCQEEWDILRFAAALDGRASPPRFSSIISCSRAFFIDRVSGRGRVGYRDHQHVSSRVLLPTMPCCPRSRRADIEY